MGVKPILFSGPMVRAILAGQKTMTRRLPNARIRDKWYEYDEWTSAVGVDIGIPTAMYSEREFYEQYPPYCAGDVLWVRETWAQAYINGGPDGFIDKYAYRADGALNNSNINVSDLFPGAVSPWYPSIHMPKKIARIFLQVTDVRMERLQEITDEQALAEGVPEDADFPIDPAFCPVCRGIRIFGTRGENQVWQERDCENCDTSVKRFRNLWNYLNGKRDDGAYAWKENPWVWAIGFERCEKPKGWC